MPAHPCDNADMLSQQSTINEVEASRLADLVRLLTDSTRIRMLFVLLEYGELCVGDMARTLGISDDAASYGLKILRSAGLAHSKRSGRTINYSLAPSFPHQLLEHCLRELLQISTQRQRPS